MNTGSNQVMPMNATNTHGSPWTQWCDFPVTKNKFRGSYPTDDTQQPLCLLKANMYEVEFMPNSNKTEKNRISSHIRDNDPFTAMPPSPANGGIFGGPQSNKPWANIPIAPTTANLINKNLPPSAPPGANTQYPGGNRLGNNYQAMPGTYWFNPENGNGMYMLKGT